MSQRTAYILTSARLRLRPIAQHDQGVLHQHWTAPDVRRFLWDDEMIGGSLVADMIVESERLFEAHGYGLWAICPADNDDLIGCAGFWTFHEPPRLELVVSLNPDQWGHGLATAAARLLIGYSFTTLDMDTILVSTDAPNAASVRLLDRLGFTATHRGLSGDLDTLFYTLAAT